MAVRSATLLSKPTSAEYLCLAVRRQDAEPLGTLTHMAPSCSVRQSVLYLKMPNLGPYESPSGMWVRYIGYGRRHRSPNGVPQLPYPALARVGPGTDRTAHLVTCTHSALSGTDSSFLRRRWKIAR